MIQIEPVVQDPMRLLRRDGLKASHTKIVRAHERAKTCAVDLAQARLPQDLGPTGLSDELIQAILEAYRGAGELWNYQERVRLVMRAQQLQVQPPISQTLVMRLNSTSRVDFALQLSLQDWVDRLKLRALYALADNSPPIAAPLMLTLKNDTGLCTAHAFFKSKRGPLDIDEKKLGEDLKCCQLKMGQLVLVEGILTVFALGNRGPFFDLKAERWRPYEGATSPSARSAAAHADEQH